MALERRGARHVEDPSITHLLNTGAAKVAPAAVVTLYGALTKGLPLVISILTLFYLAAQLAHLIWVWRGEAQRRKEAAALAK